MPPLAYLEEPPDFDAQLGGQSIDVEGLGNGLVFGARFADRLGVIKFCHRLHHTFLLRS